MQLTGWIEVIDTLIKLGWGAPQKLALVQATQILPALEGHPKALQATGLAALDGVYPPLRRPLVGILSCLKGRLRKRRKFSTEGELCDITLEGLPLERGSGSKPGQDLEASTGFRQAWFFRKAKSPPPSQPTAVQIEPLLPHSFPVSRTRGYPALL